MTRFFSSESVIEKTPEERLREILDMDSDALSSMSIEGLDALLGNVIAIETSLQQGVEGEDENATLLSMAQEAREKVFEAMGKTKELQESI